MSIKHWSLFLYLIASFYYENLIKHFFHSEYQKGLQLQLFIQIFQDKVLLLSFHADKKMVGNVVLEYFNCVITNVFLLLPCKICSIWIFFPCCIHLLADLTKEQMYIELLVIAILTLIFSSGHDMSVLGITASWTIIITDFFTNFLKASCVALCPSIFFLLTGTSFCQQVPKCCGIFSKVR